MINMSLPSRVISDVFQGTVQVPKFDFRVLKPDQSSSREFELRQSNFSRNGVWTSPTHYEPLQFGDLSEQTVLDIKEMSANSMRRWLLDFTTQMHHTSYPGWQNLSHLPEPYPQEEVKKFQKFGFSRDLAESFRYIRRGVYLNRTERDEHLIIADQNLTKDTASLRVIHNGVGVTMENSPQGVVQRDFSVLFSKEDFLRCFFYGEQDTEQELMRSMSMKMLVAAEKVFEDQHGVAADLKGEDQVRIEDLFPWPIESARLYSRENLIQLQQRINEDTLVPELVDQARIDARVSEHKQRMVDVNWYNNGKQHFIEVVVRRLQYQPLHPLFGSLDVGKSHLVRRGLRAYIEGMQTEILNRDRFPTYYSDLGLKFYVAA